MIQNIFFFNVPGQSRDNYGKVCVVAFPYKTTFFNLKYFRRVMRHLFNDLLYRDLLLMVSFKHSYHSMLYQWPARWGTGIRILFFLKGMRGMVGCYYINPVIQQRFP